MPYPVVALVGYTNAGKSTLFNRLTGSGVLAKDMLFATLDPTMRAIALPDGRKAILSRHRRLHLRPADQLVAAFRATLEEVLEADLILHVRDIAHPESEVQAENVRAILAEMGIDQDEQQARMIEVWNKVDALAAGAGRGAAAGRRPDAAGGGDLGADGGGGSRRSSTSSPARSPSRRSDETISLGFDQGRAARLALRPQARPRRASHARTATTSTSAGPTATGASTRRLADPAVRRPVNLWRPHTGGIRLVHELCIMCASKKSRLTLQRRESGLSRASRAGDQPMSRIERLPQSCILLRNQVRCRLANCRVAVTAASVASSRLTAPVRWARSSAAPIAAPRPRPIGEGAHLVEHAFFEHA